MWLRFEGFSGYKDCRIQNLKAVPGDRSRYFQISFRKKEHFRIFNAQRQSIHALSLRECV